MLLTRSPLAARLPRAAARLACVKHSASVQSEPGSNSSVQSVFFTTRSNESQRLNLHLTLLLFRVSTCFNSLASSSSRFVTLRFRAPLGTQFESCDPDQQPSLRFRDDCPLPPPAQQAPTPIGCLVFKDLPPVSAAPQSAERDDYRERFWMCKPPSQFFFAR